jgi:hypothetical protein
MTLQRKFQWLFLILTAALMVYLKWLHIGVTHYNIFLLILIGWTAFMVIAFRALTADQRTEK